MNEKIKSLLDQACQHAHDTHFAHVKSFRHLTDEQMNTAQNAMQEKFAELIIAECNKRVNQYIGDCNEVTSLPEYILEEHFGVKE